MIRFLIAILVIGVVCAGVFDYWVRTIKTTNATPQEFIIAGAGDEGGRDSLFDVGQNIEGERLINSRYYFYYHAWRNKLRGRLQAGTYIIQPESSLTEISDLFVSGEIKEVKREEVQLTFKEGLTLEEYGDVLKEGNMPYEEFLALALEPSAEIQEDFPFLPADKSLEGYLFPETYNFFVNADADAIIRKMLTTFEQRVSLSVREGLIAAGRDLDEVMILASVVEGEVREGSDRNLVAGIFTNRIVEGMALQSDATIDYIKGIPEIKHTLEDIAIDSPYNTYKYAGLPPGPINNPSLESILATINPADTPYFFFLNNATTGETVFAETYAEHLINKDQNGL